MTKQEKFFYDHAGFSHDMATETAEQGHERCAKQLAAAENWAVQNGYTFDVDNDRDADDSWLDGEPSVYQDEWRGKAQSVVMLDENNRVVQSLGGCYGYADYIRVVKAELALEEMPAVTEVL